MTEIELAYLAGIIDGEGCISLYGRGKRCEDGSWKRFTVGISVGMVDYEIPCLLRDSFGGGLCQHPPRGISRKPQWLWSISHRKAFKVLILLKPYLRIKAAQAEIAINCLARRGYFGTKKQINLELDELDRLWMGELNR